MKDVWFFKCWYSRIRRFFLQYEYKEIEGEIHLFSWRPPAAFKTVRSLP